VDRFQSDARAHRLTRYFHLAPALKATPTSKGAKIEQGDFHAELFDASAGSTSVTIAKGVRKPPFQGIMSEHEDVLVDAPELVFSTPLRKGTSTSLLSVVELGPRSGRDKYQLIESAPGKLEISIAGQRVSVVRTGHELTIQVEASPN
jgi:hypothetical protein